MGDGRPLLCACAAAVDRRCTQRDAYPLLPSGRAEDVMPRGRSILEETGGLCREIFGPRAVARAVSGGSEVPTPAASDKAEYVPLAGLDCTGVTAFGAHDTAHLLCEPASGVIFPRAYVGSENHSCRFAVCSSML